MKSKLPLVGLTSIRQRVVINDSSCLIDLRKVALVGEMLRLPYRFVVAYPLCQNELLDIAESEWGSLTQKGMEIVDLTGDQVAEAYQLRSRYGALSAEDCFSLVLAKEINGAILLTGDAQLRKVSSSLKVEVHGVLWVAEQLYRSGILSKGQLEQCLAHWRGDSTVFIHERLIVELLDRCA